jgi:hypothetical protein
VDVYENIIKRDNVIEKEDISGSPIKDFGEDLCIQTEQFENHFYELS